jgi:hypothetical protein
VPRFRISWSRPIVIPGTSSHTPSGDSHSVCTAAPYVAPRHLRCEAVEEPHVLRGNDCRAHRLDHGRRSRHDQRCSVLINAVRATSTDWLAVLPLFE